MKRLPWFKCEPGPLLGALAGMEPDQGYVYTIALLRIYEVGGPTDDDARSLARRSGLPLARVTKALQWLIDVKKLFVMGGRLFNEKAQQKLQERGEGDEARTEAAKMAAAARWEKDKQKQQNDDASRMRPDADIRKKIVDKERKKDSRPAKKQDVPVYSEEFETCWQLYPRTKNTSKKDAWNIYRMLNDENQAKVRAAVPMYAAAMKAEGRPEDKIKHMTSWLNSRTYETVSAPSAGGKPTALVDWHKTATREQWIKLLRIWRGDMNWRPSWGPAPGKHGCSVPEDLLTADEVSLGRYNRVSSRVPMAAE